MLWKVEQGVNTRSRVKVTAGAVLPGCQEGPWVGPAGPWKLSPVGEWESQLQVPPRQGCSPAPVLSSGNETAWLVPC